MAAEPPVEEPGPPEPPSAPVSADLPRRAANLLIDYLCRGLIAALVDLVVASATQGQAATLNELWPRVLFGAVVTICYYGFFESTFAATPGKWVTGTVVVNAAGGRPTFFQVLGRTLLRYIPFEFLSPFFSPERRTWHDRFSSTYVVMRRSGANAGMREF